MAIFKAMLEIGVYHIENGESNFASWSKLMIDEFGPKVQHHLKEVMEWSVVLAHKKVESSSLKRNCWDYYRCGKQSKADNGKKHDVCPAYLETKLNGVHDGKNGGRACWIVAGTKCGGIIKRTLIPKFIICNLCDFKKIVMSEESQNFIVSDDFMKILVH
jgi:hypothetical protein